MHPRRGPFSRQWKLQRGTRATDSAAAAAATIVDAGAIASGEVLGQPGIAATIDGGSVASGEAFGQPTIAAVIGAAGIATGEAFGQPNVAGTVGAVGIASGEQLGAPAIAAVLSTTGVVPGALVGAPDAVAVVAPAGVSSAEAFGQPFIGPPQQIVDAGGIATQEAFGAPTVDLAAVQTYAQAGYTVEPRLRVREPRAPEPVELRLIGIHTGEGFGLPLIELGPRPRNLRDEEWLLRRAA
jgi:hypothetical protein